MSGEDKFIKKYKQPEQLIGKIDFKSKNPLPPPIEELEAHDLPIVCFDASTKGFISGGSDGVLQVREYSNFSAVRMYKVHGWKASNLKCVTKSSIAGIVYTGSEDGCFQIWRVSQGPQVALSDTYKIEEPAYKPLSKA